MRDRLRSRNKLADSSNLHYNVPLLKDHPSYRHTPLAWNQRVVSPEEDH